VQLDLGLRNGGEAVPVPQSLHLHGESAREPSKKAREHGRRLDEVIARGAGSVIKGGWHVVDGRPSLGGRGSRGRRRRRRFFDVQYVFLVQYAIRIYLDAGAEKCGRRY
jgi:hypothetical protein